MKCIRTECPRVLAVARYDDKLVSTTTAAISRIDGSVRSDASRMLVIALRKQAHVRNSRRRAPQERQANATFAVLGRLDSAM